MKRIFATTAIIAAFAAPAFADGHAMVQAGLDELNIAADASTLSESELAQLEFALNGSFPSPASKKGRIMTILEGADAIKAMPSETEGRVMIDLSMNSLRTQVENRVDLWDVDCDVYALSDAEVTELYLGINSSMTDADALNKAKAACQS